VGQGLGGWAAAQGEKRLVPLHFGSASAVPRHLARQTRRHSGSKPPAWGGMPAAHLTLPSDWPPGGAEPVYKVAGDAVIGGTVNMGSALRIRASRQATSKGSGGRKQQEREHRRASQRRLCVSGVCLLALRRLVPPSAPEPHLLVTVLTVPTCLPLNLNLNLSVYRYAGPCMWVQGRCRHGALSDCAARGERAAQVCSAVAAAL